jgi:hypothetical protein
MNDTDNKDLAILDQKIDSMEKLGDSKYASFKDLSNLTIEVAGIKNKFIEALEGLKQRFNDDIASRKYMTATIISIISLALVVVTTTVSIGINILKAHT